MNKIIGLKNFTKSLLNLHKGKITFDPLNYNGVNKRMMFVCAEHGNFMSSPANIKKAREPCKQCRDVAYDAAVIANFVKQSESKFGKGKFDYSLIEADSVRRNTKLNLICNTHGKINLTPRRHLAEKNGCIYCNGSYICRTKIDLDLKHLLEINPLYKLKRGKNVKGT